MIHKTALNFKASSILESMNYVNKCMVKKFFEWHTHKKRNPYNSYKISATNSQT